MSKRMLIITLVVFLITAAGVAVFWPRIERLVTPGPLSTTHAELENKCSACHIAFTPLAERPKCKSCHEEVAADIEQRRGFHGRTPEVRETQCRTCHVEHRGTQASLVDLDDVRFDHAKTDFPIAGGHSELQ